MNGLSRTTVVSNSAAGRDPDWAQARQSCRKGRLDYFGDSEAHIFWSISYGDPRIPRRFLLHRLGLRSKSMWTDWRVEVQAVHPPI
jgi:hypothetical protein